MEFLSYSTSRNPGHFLWNKYKEAHWLRTQGWWGEFSGLSFCFINPRSGQSGNTNTRRQNMRPNKSLVPVTKEPRKGQPSKKENFGQQPLRLANKGFWSKHRWPRKWWIRVTTRARLSHNLGTLNQSHLVHLSKKLQNRKHFIGLWERAPSSDGTKTKNVNAVLPSPGSNLRQNGRLEDYYPAPAGAGRLVYSKQKGLMKPKWNVLECSRSKLGSSPLRREKSKDMSPRGDSGKSEVSLCF